MWVFPSIDTCSVCLPWERKDNEICVGDKLGLKWQKGTWFGAHTVMRHLHLDCDLELCVCGVVTLQSGITLQSIYFFHREFTKPLTFCWSWSICLGSACLQRSAVKVNHPFANSNCSSNGTRLWTCVWINSWKKVVSSQLQFRFAPTAALCCLK